MKPIQAHISTPKWGLAKITGKLPNTTRVSAMSLKFYYPIASDAPQREKLATIAC